MPTTMPIWLIAVTAAASALVLLTLVLRAHHYVRTGRWFRAVSTDPMDIPLVADPDTERRRRGGFNPNVEDAAGQKP